MRELRLGAAELSLLPVIRGLVSEAERVRGLLENAPADTVGLSISPEELAVIQENPDLQASPSSVEEAVYMRELEQFGPVQKPPPCFVEAARVAKQRGIPCVALDMGEEPFTNLFLEKVGGFALIRHSRHVNKLAKSTFVASSPDAFVVEFDALANRVRGYRRVEEAREAYIAAALEALSTTTRKPWVLIERERFEGVEKRLRLAPTGTLRTN